MKKLLVVLALVGCGKSGGGGDSAPATPIPAAASTSMLVADKASLPTCDTTRSGQLAYVKAESKFYGCDGSAWAEVAIKGEKGDTGAAAPSPTSIGKVKFTMYCNATLNMNLGVDFSNVIVSYWATQMDSGDVWVSATVADPSKSLSESRYYANNQTGSVTGGVQITMDGYSTANSGWWKLEVDRTSKLLNVNYNDADLPSVGTRFWVFPAAACTIQSY